MARLEAGGDREQWILEVGKQIANYVLRYLALYDLPAQVTLLVGKGNNGSDALAAGVELLSAGVNVSATSPFDRGNSLNQQWREKFCKAGGIFSRDLEGLLLDGLFGTGFQGKIESRAASLIKEANESKLPILSIDIPSGIDATTGQQQGVAIFAQETLTLGFAKIGCFLGSAWNHVGKLTVIDFGLPQEISNSAQAVAYLPTHISLPQIVRNRNKYDAGLVVGYGDSKEFSGALCLAGLAALRAGAGIVHLYYPKECKNLNAAPELICTAWNNTAWQKSLHRAQGVFVGPGISKSAAAQKWVKQHVRKIKQPCVIDADALMPDAVFPEHAILTPHRGEALRLLGITQVLNDEDLLTRLSWFCEKHRVLIILKGAPSFVLVPHQKPFIITRGNPGMATAGTGDVLTGILAALLAQGLAPMHAALLGTLLHGIAGEKAAANKTPYCMIASDLIDHLPQAFEELDHS